MITPRLLAASICMFVAFSLADKSIAQVGGSPDPASFVDFSLATLSSFKASDRRAGRSLIAKQIGLLPSDKQALVTGDLLSRLGSADINSKVDIANILALYPASWSTNDTDADAKDVYGKFLNSKDETLKSALDNALANARGLYRDGIRDFNNPKIESLKSAEAKLRMMASSYPESRYAENASFYLGLAVANQYILGDTRGTALLRTSDALLEDYIVKVREKKFGKKSDFHAAGYFFRGLNSWIQNDLKDARKWMDEASRIFSDDDSIYVYQLVLSPGIKTAVIDRFLPARSTFTATLKFLNTEPVPQYPKIDTLTTTLSSL